jgi:ribosomal protein L13
MISLVIAMLACAMQPARAATAERSTTRSHTASFESRQHARQTRRPATLFEQSISGVIPRAIRGGNPLQMLNPFAPAKYGTAADNVSVDPDVPGKVNGVKFVSIPF